MIYIYTLYIYYTFYIMSYASYHMLMIFCTTYQYVQPLYTIERISNISLDSVFLKIVFKVYITHSNSWCYYYCRQPGQPGSLFCYWLVVFFLHTLCRFASFLLICNNYYYQTTTTFVLIINILYTM